MVLLNADEPARKLAALELVALHIHELDEIAIVGSQGYDLEYHC